MDYKECDRIRQKISCSRDMLNKALSESKKAADQAKKLRDVNERALTVVREVLMDAQRDLCGKIEGVVSTALDIVFPDTYSFKMEYVTKAGKSAVELSLTDNEGNNINDIIDSSAGGVVHVVAMALRIGCLLLSGVPRFLCMDEPFNAVSKERHGLIAEMMKLFSEKMAIQWIVVTHERGLIDDDEMINVIEV